MRGKIVTIVAAVLAVAFAAWGGYGFCIWADSSELMAGSSLAVLIPVYILCLLFGVFLEQLIHEGAHFLIGAIVGMGVRPPKIRFFHSSSIEVNPHGLKCIRLRFVLTALAGVFFDLLLVVLGALAFSVPYISPILGIVSPYALYSLIVNAAPLQYGVGKTDGLVALEMTVNTPTAKVMTNIFKMQALLHKGVLLKDMDESLLLDVPQLPEDDLNFIILTQLRYEYYLAKGNDSEAYKYFRRFQELIKYLPSEYMEHREHDIIKK